MRQVLLVAAALAVQCLLGWPGLPPWTADLIVPAALIVAPVMLLHGRRWPVLALGIGIGWDLLMEEVVGPGGIAWTAAALCLEALAAAIADRRPRTWAVFGGLAGAMVVVFRAVCHLPLGLQATLSVDGLLRVVLLTALWCGFVGWVIEADLPTKWGRHRARRLR